MRKLGYILYVLFSAQFADAQEKDTASRENYQPDSSKAVLLQEVIVQGKKPLVQVFPDKTVINVGAAVTNTGATILEVLEKSPGISMDKNGNISLKGRHGVLIMIDGKPAQVSGTDLNNLLSGIAASQVDQIEILDNPSAKYDAAGNAGIINIKTKKNRQKGFNGSLSLSAGQGRYARTNNNLDLNYYSGKINVFANLGINVNRNFTDLYALRTYYQEDNKTITSTLEQPSLFRGKAPSQTVKVGFDYYASSKTTVGAVFTGTSYKRTTRGNNNAIWMDESGRVDSIIRTISNNKNKYENFGLNLNAKQSFNASSELTADFDFIGYRINNNQNFSNALEGNNGYVEMVTGLIPSDLNIFTGKADYTESYGNGIKLDMGWKSSHVKTNNRAEYFLDAGSGPQPDYGKTNHFLYEENIHAAYANLERKNEKWTLQGGLRYEYTAYDAHQLGNAVRKDSSFSRNYDGLFPSALVSLQLYSSNNISLSAGRRIDRPNFHSLNPFVFVINKYTYESGNPFYRPQYTWNFQLNYIYKDILTAGVDYSTTKDYFSQIFLQDSTGIITYTEGNLDRMENIGVSAGLQTPVFNWWDITAQAYINHKKIRGFVWTERTASLVQANLNVSNQFSFKEGWSGEISGFISLKEQELQEITDPYGQLSVGVAKQFLNNKATLRLTVRDIFYTQWMKGWTTFQQSTEYFKLTRDTRTASLSFTYRFGRQTKKETRKTGGAEEEINRVGAQN